MGYADGKIEYTLEPFIDKDNNSDIIFIEEGSTDILLEKTKEILGYSKNQLVFISSLNLANYYWCAWQYYLTSMEDEKSLFLVYLYDMYRHAIKLGLLDNPPYSFKEIIKY